MLESRMICGCMVKGSRPEPGVHFENNGEHGSFPRTSEKPRSALSAWWLSSRAPRSWRRCRILANQGPNGVNGGTRIVPLDPPVSDVGAAGPLCWVSQPSLLAGRPAEPTLSASRTSVSRIYGYSFGVRGHQGSPLSSRMSASILSIRRYITDNCSRICFTSSRVVSFARHAVSTAAHIYADIVADARDFAL